MVYVAHSLRQVIHPVNNVSQKSNDLPRHEAVIADSPICDIRNTTEPSADHLPNRAGGMRVFGVG